MINPFLKFNGNCEEAMKFYQVCFGGSLDFVKVSDSPAKDSFPIEMQSMIMRAKLIGNEINIAGSDISEDDNSNIYTVVGSLLYTNKDKQRLTSMFYKVSKEGMIKHDLSISFFNTLHGSFTDKFNVDWVFFEEI